MSNIFFRPEDFDVIKHTFLIRNDTSGTSISNSDQITPLEFFDEGVLLKIPKNSCKEGHILTIFIFNDDDAKNVKRIPSSGTIKKSFEIVGKVIKITIPKDKDLPKSEKNFVSIELKFTQFDPVKWKSLSEKYQAQQERINSLMKKNGI